MEPYFRDAASVDVGQRLRELRDERHVSMRALARSSGLSANALSMIERGLTSPSVSTLNKLANALSVPITAFFRLEPAKEQIVFRRASERSRVPFLRGLIEGLGGESYTGKVEALLLTLENGGNSGPGDLYHSGHEIVFVLRGELEYEIQDQRYTLGAGDSLIFSARLAHRWRNPGGSVVNAIIIICSFEGDERPSEFHIAGVDMDGSDLRDLENRENELADE